MIFADASKLVRPKGWQYDCTSNALERWCGFDRAAADDSDPTVIDIYDIIGEDWWTGEGFTEKKLAGILRKVGNADVTVNINSPGGDVFQCVAIYNRLKRHEGKVNVNVTGLAASAASVIAMAGDKVTMYTGTMLMIHRAWGMVIGNRNDLEAMIPVFDKVDRSMADIYPERTNESDDDILAMMDAETWLTVEDAVENGFADEVVEENKTKAHAKVPDDILAKRQIEAALAKEGHTRKQREAIIKNLSGSRDAPGSTAPRDAGNEWAGYFDGLVETMNRSVGK